MGKRIAATDAYIRGAQPFARPILEHLREVVHAACPDAEEKIRWGMPFFDYRGQLCYMAAFKAHAAFGFYRHADLVAASRSQANLDRSAMGSFGRLEAIGDLPPRRALAAFVKLAMKLADERARQAAGAARKTRPVRRPPAPAKPAKRKAAAKKR